MTRRERVVHVAARAVLAAAFLGGAVVVAVNVSQSEFHKPAPIQFVSLVEDEPPPPPELPDLPEPEIEQEIEAPPEPVDLPDLEDTPGLEDLGELGLDGEAAAGFDAFGLVAKRGGRDLLAERKQLDLRRIGNVIERHLSDTLAQFEDLRRRNYTVLVSLWLDGDGQIQTAEISRSTGDRLMDEAIAGALDNIPPVPSVIPEGLPQPIRLRITARGAH